MRLLMRGFTLIELLVTIAIAAIMMSLGAPMLSDYITNARLRGAGDTMFAEALFTQSEAIKRNGPVQMAVNGNNIQVRDMTPAGLAADPAGRLLRDINFPEGVAADVATTVAFTGEGRTTPFGTAFTVDLSRAGITCSAEHRCPSLRVDAGGAVRLCGDRTNSSC
jgi:type IV fimbrial biogenesis protein FimT